MASSSITLTSPLPAAALFFESMQFSAGLSVLGEMQLQLLSPRADLKPEDLLGQPITVHVQTAGEAPRYFNGYVTRFGLGMAQGRYHAYQASVRPWLWFLTRTSDCRIFQNLSVPEIVKKVFDDHSIANFQTKLFRDYAKRTYCVQYRESDYNFVARLLEQEGIYWYIEHADGTHKLILVDAQSAHDAAPGCPSLRYIEDPRNAPPGQEYVTQWRFSQGVETGKVALTSYDFERPSTSLLVSTGKPQKHKLADYEQFDFAGDYRQSAEGSQYAENRADAEQSQFEQQQAHANAAGIEVGRRLKLSHHPREDQNREYLITHLQIRAHLDLYRTDATSSTGGTRFDSEFQAIPAAQQFRPPRLTPKPLVQGPQTAMVVGPSGDEIHTDKYGRVKVQFHWDRYGQKNETSSCWVRVSHPWAGKNFGGIHIPRIGQEVVVDFLEGDPDQPLITGRVYNAEQMPPWDLPANATQSGLLSRSSQGGGYGNANAIRFEDKKGSEQLWIQAEKDLDTEVEHDETHSVGHNRSKSVGGSETATVVLQRTHAVGLNETIAIGAAQEVVIGAYQTANVGGYQDVNVGEKRTTNIGEDDSLHVGKNLVIEAGDAITLKTGSASITLKKDGTITLQGKNITLDGSGKVSIKASGDVVVKGAKILQN
jgi:type VI secretion system secreted protein VgrG